MAASRLTVRTLGLATVALALACVHAAQATGVATFTVKRGSGSRVATTTGGPRSGGAAAVASASRAQAVRISTPARPLSQRAGSGAAGSAGPVRRISIGPGSAGMPARRAEARPVAAAVKPAAAVRPATPEVAAALRTPDQGPALRRNAFALPVAALAVAATEEEARAEEPAAPVRVAAARGAARPGGGRSRGTPR